MTIADEMKENFYTSKKLCFENPKIFMVCPRCAGTKLIASTDFIRFFRKCDYCNGEGVICWIDKVTRNLKNPFLEERK